ncbi:DUF202 domain-containing protein [Alkalisalibacterium limincola]|uniref:DUF202 domain-containing protein n=2 Tax=Alkalisalibacterium limincola TaxID=2699169 RepID=A0A5C8KYY6_9GAMM|nr:DUF202 domain-containing protein [Alkalisalibacterium limincola]
MSTNGGTEKAGADRTDLAEDRTRLAIERTFAGWMRTSMAMVVLALGLRALMRNFEPDWIPKLAGTALIFAAAIVAVSGWRRAIAVLGRLESHVTESTPNGWFSVVAGLVIASYAVIAVLIWLAF